MGLWVCMCNQMCDEQKGRDKIMDIVIKKKHIYYGFRLVGLIFLFFVSGWPASILTWSCVWETAASLITWDCRRGSRGICIHLGWIMVPVPYWII